MIGALLLVPALFAWVWSYLLPTIATVVRSFQDASWLGPDRFVGIANYRSLPGQALGSIGFGLRMVVLPLAIGLLVAPLLAMLAHRGGTVARRLTLALTGVPLVCYAPVAVAAGWLQGEQGRLGPAELSTPNAARNSLASMVAWTSVGLIVAAGTTVALLAVRGRRPRVAVPTVGAVLGLGVLAVGLQLFTIPAMVTDGGPSGATMTPVLQIMVVGIQRFDFGFAAAWSTLLLVILAVLGVAAVVVLLAVRARVEYLPARNAPRSRKPVLLAISAVLLLGLLAVMGYGLAPWFGSMLGGWPLPNSDSPSRMLAYTWLPPLVSALVGVFVAFLGGIGIGALRPLGARSELLLLVFAPWLFVGTGPLALAGYDRALGWHQLGTFIGLIPPTWLSVPALVLFTLLFRGLSGQWRAAGAGYDRLLSMVALPALPMLGAAVLLVWLAGAQQLLWPELVLNGAPTTAGITVLRQGSLYTLPVGEHSSAVGLLYPLPLLALFAVAFVALGIWYLDRLAIQVGTGRGPTGSGAQPALPEAGRSAAGPSPDRDRSGEDRGTEVRGLRSRAYIAIGSALVLLLAGVVVVRALTHDQTLPPEDTVTEYFAALNARDGATALTYLAPNWREKSFTNKAKPPDPSELIKGDGYDPPTDVRILALHTTKDRGYASVTYRVAGALPAKHQLTLVKLEDSGAGSRRGWLIDNGMPFLNINMTGQEGLSLTVNGHTLPPGVGLVDAFPGRYQVGLADYPLLEAEPIVAFAGAWTGTVPQLQVGVKRQIKAAVEAKVRSYVDGCARRAEVSPAYCPFNAASLGAIRKVRWSIITYPVIAVGLSNSTATLYVYTTTRGRVDVTGVNAEGRALHGRFAFTVAGTVDMYNERISFIPHA